MPEPLIGDRLERFTLPNGLRVVLAPSTAVPVVGIAVLYDVGIRSEPVGRTGFAHLFEHLMFQGSEKVPKLAHARYVQGAGGSFNGSTHLDYTVYHETLPSTALERGLFLEADRMRGPRITERNLRNQVDVVSEEINTSVKNRPYGGFPWLHLPPLLFDGFANTHDGYGSQVDLDSATVAEANAFFEQYYAPANAVLCVAGGIDVEETTALVARHFGTVPARPVPVRPSFAEPALTGSRRGAHRDPLARSPRSRRAGGSPTRSANSGRTSPTSCSPICSRAASRRGWSSGWCRPTARSRTCPPGSA